MTAKVGPPRGGPQRPQGGHAGHPGGGRRPPAAPAGPAGIGCAAPRGGPMGFVSRGFRGRRRSEGPPGRVPPGQYLVDDFPVLSAGPTPDVVPRRLGLHHHRRDRRAADVDLGGAPGAPPRGDHARHPLRHQVVEARHGLGGRVGGRPARRRRDRRRVRAGPLLRRLHHQPAARGPHRRQGLGRLRLRRRAARAGARRPGAPAGPPPLLLEERQVGARPRPAPTDAPGFWERYGYHNYGDPWLEQRYAGD